MSRDADVRPEWRRELAFMLMYNRKAETEALCDVTGASDLSQILDGAQYAPGPRLVEYILARV